MRDVKIFDETIKPHINMKIEIKNNGNEAEQEYIKETSQALIEKIGNDFIIEYKGDLKWEICPKITQTLFQIKLEV